MEEQTSPQVLGRPLDELTAMDQLADAIAAAFSAIGLTAFVFQPPEDAIERC